MSPWDMEPIPEGSNMLLKMNYNSYKSKMATA
jgi:hypothetical protein